MSDAHVSTGVWLFPEWDAATMLDAIGAAEDGGLDEVWLGDEGPGRDPFAILGAAARSTSRVRLGIAVTNPYLRHPAATAAAAQTVNELSGGRFTLGLGAGGGLALDPVGIVPANPVERVRDAVRITRAVATGAAVDGYDPPPHAVPAAPLPIVIGARGERLNRLASDVADGVFIGGIPIAMLDTTIAWAHSRRPIAVVLSFATAFDEQSLERLRPQLLWTLADAPAITRERLGVDATAVTAAIGALVAGDDGPARRLVDSRLVGELALSGDGPELVSRVRTLIHRFDPTSLVLNLHECADPVEAVRAAASVLAEARTRVPAS